MEIGIGGLGFSRYARFIRRCVARKVSLRGSFRQLLAIPAAGRKASTATHYFLPPVGTFRIAETQNWNRRPMPLLSPVTSATKSLSALTMSRFLGLGTLTIPPLAVDSDLGRVSTAIAFVSTLNRDQIMKLQIAKRERVLLAVNQCSARRVDDDVRVETGLQHKSIRA